MGWTINPFILQTLIFHLPKFHPSEGFFGLPKQFLRQWDGALWMGCLGCGQPITTHSSFTVPQWHRKRIPNPSRESTSKPTTPSSPHGPRCCFGLQGAGARTWKTSAGPCTVCIGNTCASCATRSSSPPNARHLTSKSRLRRFTTWWRRFLKTPRMGARANP